MKIIDPRPFDPTKITTNVPLTETLWTAGQYNTGTRRYVTPSDDLYEVVAVPHTNDEPVEGASLEVKTWAKVGKVNRYACFDNVLQNPTTFSDGIDMTIAGTGISYSNAIAILNVAGGAVRVTVTDPTDGVVYDKTMSIIDHSPISDWEVYFTAPFFKTPDLVLVDLPLYPNAEVRVRIDGAGQIGELALGYMTTLAATTWGTSVSILDYSEKEADVFGGFNVIERGYANVVDFKCYVPTARVAAVRNELAARRARPTVYIGSENFAETIVFGYYQNFTETLSGPVQSDFVVEVKGLV